MKNKNQRPTGNILLVAKYESNVGYAWWLMENYWVQISRYFSGHHRRCILIYPKIVSSQKNLMDAGIMIEEHDFSDVSFTGLGNLHRLIVKHQIKSIYLSDRKYYSLYYALLRAFGISRIVVHDHAGGEKPIVVGIKKWLKKIIYIVRPITCDYYIGVSRFIRDRMMNSDCVPEDRCTYVLNGIVPIECGNDARDSIRREFSFPHDSIVVVSTGRASKYKGVEFIIRCIEKILCNNVEEKIYFLHCGDGPDLDNFKKLSRELGLQKRCVFAGRREKEDVLRILTGCDIAFQASRGEAFSLSILEYMSAGLATLVPDHCGNREAIIEGVNGYLYPPGNMNTAIEKLLKLFGDEDLRHHLGAAAKESVIREFTLDRANVALIEALADKL